MLSEFAVFSELEREVRVGFLLVGIGVTRAVVASVTGVTSIAGVFLSTSVVFIFVSIGSSGVVGIGALALIIGVLGLQSG